MPSTTRSVTSKNMPGALLAGRPAWFAMLRLSLVLSFFLSLPSVRCGLLDSLLGSSESVEGARVDASLEALLKWFQSQGGSLHPSVTLRAFEGYGNGLSTTSSADASVSELETMFVVPSKIIMTKQKIAGFYHKNSDKKDIAKVISSISMDDYAIAAQLIVECSLGTSSRFFPYTSILPKEVPTLDSFSPSELSLLQDESLTKTAEKAQATIQSTYEQIEPFIDMMINVAAGVNGVSEPDRGCNTLQNFRHYSAVVGSRAMVIKGKKHLAPLADMANYKPNGTPRKPGEHGASFLTYHQLTEGGDLVVKCDRDVGTTDTQIFEDYGDNDNSLYIEAHGFVPFTNPFNCATVRPPKLDYKSEEGKIVINAMKYLAVVPEDFGTRSTDKNEEALDVGELCATLANPVPSQSSKQYAYLSLLGLGMALPSNARGKLELCRQIVDGGGDRKQASAACVRYSGSDEVVREIVRSGAREAIEKLPTTLEEDLKTLALATEGKFTMRGTMALRYRIEKKKLLHLLSTMENSNHNALPSSSSSSPSSSASSDDDSYDLTTAVSSFNSFVESLNFPVNLLTAFVAGDGMRVGTRATAPVQFGEVYISVPVTAVMSSDTASTFKFEANKLLDKSRAKRDDFHTLLFFLMHERFVAKEESMWWPYLRLLPSLKEYKENNPIFFSEEKLDFLVGSDAREIIQQNQIRGKKGFEDMSKDKDVLAALGSAWTEPNFLWAMTILDSRSIWWQGKRHLVPLLDLINCQEGPDPTVVHSTTVDDSGKNAITKAPWSFEAGEQVFENYGQPNYVYFVYHGFVLKSNTHDCSPFEATIGQFDKAASNMDLLRKQMSQEKFSSYIYKFCLRENKLAEELEKVGRFLLIRDGVVIDGKPDGSLAGSGLSKKDALPRLKELFTKLLLKYPKTPIAAAPPKDYSESCMAGLVEREKDVLKMALDFIVELEKRGDEL